MLRVRFARIVTFDPASEMLCGNAIESVLRLGDTLRDERPDVLGKFVPQSIEGSSTSRADARFADTTCRQPSAMIT